MEFTSSEPIVIKLTMVEQACDRALRGGDRQIPGSLPSQSSLRGELQVNDRSCLKTQNGCLLRNNIHGWPVTSTWTHICAYITADQWCLHAHIYVHTPQLTNGIYMHTHMCTHHSWPMVSTCTHIYTYTTVDQWHLQAHTYVHTLYATKTKNS